MKFVSLDPEAAALPATASHLEFPCPVLAAALGA
eukprot:COSAG04_NODE_32642_length_201_cov_2.450980_2_plen_33_part_01